MVDDAIHDGIVCEESDDLHGAAALRADHRINFIDFPEYIGPAFGGDGPELLLHHPERESLMVCLDLAPMGVGVQPIISHPDLALVRDIRGHPGDELQVVHPLQIFGLFPILVADLGFPFIQGEALQGKERPDHVFAHPLGLFLGPGPHLAVD